MNKLFCDHCGEELKAPLRPEWYRTEVRLPKGNFRGHLCEPCADWIKRWFSSSLSEFTEKVAAGA